jgi:uncharacterized protein
MSKEVAFRAVDLLIDHLKKNRQGEDTWVKFFGGEPLLNWDLIKQVVDYVEKKKKTVKNNINFTISTNGVLLDQKKIDFMRKHDFSYRLSIDSHDPRRHNKLRPTKTGLGSYNKIMRNLNLFKETDPLTINMTLTKKNLAYFDYIKFFSSYKQIQAIDCGYNVSKDGMTGLGEKELGCYRREVNKYADYVIRSWEKGIAIMPLRHYLHLMGLLQTNTKAVHCAIVGESLSVSTSGDLYVCDVLDGIKKFCVGNVFTGIDQVLFNNLIGEISGKKDDECLSCGFNNVCDGCFACSYLLEGEIKRASRLCGFIRADFEVAQRLLDKLNELIGEKKLILSN